MKLSIVSFLGFFLTHSFIFAQANNEQKEFINYFNPSTNIFRYDINNSKVEGTKYLNPKFFPARLSADQVIYNMRYNAFADEMEIEKEGKTYVLIKQHEHRVTFLNTNKIYQLLDFTEGTKHHMGFFVVVIEGNKLSLLKKERIEFFKEVKPNSGYDKYQPARLERIPDKLYYTLDKKNAIRLSSKKKNILNIFSNKAMEVENFVKKNKLKFNKEKDLIEIFNYYNTIF